MTGEPRDLRDVSIEPENGAGLTSVPPGSHPGPNSQSRAGEAGGTPTPLRSRGRVPLASRSSESWDSPTVSPVVAGSRLVVVEASEFAAVEEASAEPLLGTRDQTILAKGGSAVWYGNGGAGKTTLGLDQSVHLAAGRDWLGLAVPNPCTVLWIENEGPRGKFREKVRAKLDTWDGPSLEGRLHVLDSPWAQFTFADDGLRVELVELIVSLGIDVVFAGPVQRLGVEGGGTPEQIMGFVDLLEKVRADLDRPLAYELIHHENKAGGVSGAWEGATDTLAHVQARGNGHTAVVWEKARWASEIHGRTWKLNWRDGQSFEVDDTPETTADDIADSLLDLVRNEPGGSWRTYASRCKGGTGPKREVRDRLLEEGRLVNVGAGSGMSLFLREQVSEQTTLGGDDDDDEELSDAFDA